PILTLWQGRRSRSAPMLVRAASRELLRPLPARTLTISPALVSLCLRPRLAPISLSATLVGLGSDKKFILLELVISMFSRLPAQRSLLAPIPIIQGAPHRVPRLPVGRGFLRPGSLVQPARAVQA